jgi:hypothetical protein
MGVATMTSSPKTSGPASTSAWRIYASDRTRYQTRPSTTAWHGQSKRLPLAPRLRIPEAHYGLWVPNAAVDGTRSGGCQVQVVR